MKKTKIVIAGGGFEGLSSAMYFRKGLAPRADMGGTLVKREKFMSFTAMLPRDDSARRQLLTFVTAGGGFSGAETTGALNDFVRDTARHYPDLSEELIRVVVVHPGAFLLPELGEELGRYAERKLRERKVEVIKGPRVADYDGVTVTLSDGTSIPAVTLIWTAGVKPSPVIAQLPCEKVRGRLLVSEYLAGSVFPCF